ncbi:hypothetical protein FRC0485_01486 [Corynebacterium diphtheriae]|nr:hypothetical protein FRC0485_01486 [Corynebacterium diphtheriae]
MASATSISTDASLESVVSVFSGIDGVSTGTAQFLEGFPEEPTYYMVTEKGGRMTVAQDLKFDVDELETWVAVYEQEDEGLARRLFDVLARSLSERVTICAPDSADIVEEANV